LNAGRRDHVRDDGGGVNARNALSLLFPPIRDEFGWDRDVTAGIFSFRLLVSARSGLPHPSSRQKYGTR
jgi:hypothetical protein